MSKYNFQKVYAKRRKICIVTPLSCKREKKENACHCNVTHIQMHLIHSNKKKFFSLFLKIIKNLEIKAKKFKMSKIIAVFGATGAQGGSVMRALLDSGKYQVRAITRNSNSDKAKQLASLKSVSVHEANLSDAKSLDKTLSGCHGTFLVTDFWSDPHASPETEQGVNLIESALKNKVAHVVFSGLENASSVIGKPVVHLDNKAKVEQYGLKATLDKKV